MARDKFSRVARKKRQRSDERIFVPVFVKYIYVVISGAVKNSGIDIERIVEYNKSINYDQEEHMDKYDAVVIGAGNGGLVAAIRLLQGGAKVLVVEKHNLPGGFATSFRRGRFEFEASLHELNDFGPADNGGDVRALFDALGVTDKVEWTPIPEAYRVIARKEKLDVTMPFGIKAFIDKMEKEVPGSRLSTERFFQLADDTRAAQKYTNERNGVVESGVRQLCPHRLLFGQRSTRFHPHAQKGAGHPQGLLVLSRRALRRSQLFTLRVNGHSIYFARRDDAQDEVA